jgi:hypothetical protein
MARRWETGSFAARGVVRGKGRIASKVPGSSGRLLWVTRKPETYGAATKLWIREEAEGAGA